ncbi:LytTR family DNA-binding domain-containing protein [Psychroserpens sp.]|uniref:LytR/AlgR family response regulator transcription factor n=1 Tax=Psychroserpens sp. TaxID=2020870 RepID=UPI001B1C1788|nr:LytTR family DNA-binding domain-containing protein [Psychroserpens sp.]MBO6605307.1 response regulator transcription factor [Psychroserpens sp.]MBO6630010.1 response regulator transcription factor [Psychroserpens sp.]MBO6653884.1 response regulator transcription factor [Psychroserpens sp.]MBO6682205.1 response regulator transcription factor [Psychroserpens sp.]MBO6748681.1 response regulator transcription factor [Psychroserpens sp.]
MLTAIIIEDYPEALELLKRDLERDHSDIQVIDTAQSVVEGAKVLRKTEPDILFLDIMLGDGTGFDILEIFPDINSKIIFVTASDEFAIKAFKFAAIDYVLKPYSKEDLSVAIERAKQQIRPDQERINILKETLIAPEKKPNKISLHTLDKIIIVNLDDIIRCESDSNNTMFHLKDKRKIFVTKTLKYFSDMLKSYGYLRVHQSHLVNLQYISAFIKTDGGYLMLNNGENVPVSVRKKAEVIEILDQMHR